MFLKFDAKDVAQLRKVMKAGPKEFQEMVPAMREGLKLVEYLFNALEEIANMKTPKGFNMELVLSTKESATEKQINAAKFAKFVIDAVTLAANETVNGRSTRKA